MLWNSLKYGLVYFTLVFGAGFILGTIRVLLIEPKLGMRYAELIEMPVMLFVIYLSAGFVVSKMDQIKQRLPYFITGMSALVLLLLFEFTLVLGLQSLSIEQYLDSRDIVAFSAYIISLLIFAFMPLFIKIGKTPKNPI